VTSCIILKPCYSPHHRPTRAVAAAAAIQIVTVGAVKAKCTGTEAGTRLDA
jgi:hypothetical protein